MLQRTSIFVALAVLFAFTTVTAVAKWPGGGGAAAASYAAFVRIDGIRGEEKGWIGVDEIDSDITQPLSIEDLSEGKVPTETRGTSKQEGTFTLIRSAGKATPKLAESVCKSANLESLGDVVLELCRTDGDKGVYMRYVLGDCLISSYAIELGRTAGSITETFTLNYDSVAWEYDITVQEDGVRRAPITVNEEGVRRRPITVNEEGIRRSPITVNEGGIRRSPATINEPALPPRKR